MTVTNDQVATLRAQLAGNLEEHKRLLGQLDQETDGASYATLVSAAFFLAVNRRFAKQSTTADVINFVSDVRTRFGEAAEKIEPRTAERLILAMLTDEDIADLDGTSVVRTQMLLLAALIADEQLDQDGLEEFLERARKLAIS